MGYSLCLTLGHNSSAILIESGRILVGYENERITGIKGDSQFPIHAIDEITKYYNLDEVVNVYVSHWSTFGNVDEMSNKHWRKDLLVSRCPNAIVMDSIDHHDAHVEILRVFTGKPFEWEIVADGFGNFNEVVSIYNEGKLVHRCFGFEKSLGLLYQYTTAYLDLKMNQDEYKLLGYEAHIKDVAPNFKIKDIQNAAETYAKKYAKRILEPQIVTEYDLVAGLEALPNIRMRVRDYNEYILFSKLGYKKKSITIHEKRVIMAFFVQTTIELVMAYIVKHFGMREVALTGGIFMNVKLNNSIAKYVDKISILPICGDQSCGLGVYQRYQKDLKWPGHLSWGRRDLSGFNKDEKNVAVIDGIKDSVSWLIHLLKKNKIVNIVMPNMEFGSRALGFTSTLMLPTLENVEYNNNLNKRSTIMPMAGMVHDSLVKPFYSGASKTYKSLSYMIMTLDADEEPLEPIKGCHHRHPINGSYTNRVQVVDDSHFLYLVLDELGMLINTSYNYHGQTIPLSEDQIRSTIDFQNERDVDNRILTIICKESVL